MKAPGKSICLLLFSVMIIWVFCGCTGPAGQQGAIGPSGAGITNASVNDSGHLVLTLTDGKTIDAGNVVGPQGPSGNGSFADLVPKVEMLIVRIDVKVRNGIDSGSGTIIDKRGYIVTNNHVITGGQSIEVTLKDGSSFTATVIAADKSQDLAIIKLDTTRTDFPVMTLGTMADVVVGESVMAMGFPGGINLPGPATFTEGVISAMRNYNGNNYIQTDTPINPGNSGGCLFTISGKMIGIPCADLSPGQEDFEDINLAIPIDQVIAYIQQNVQ